MKFIEILVTLLLSIHVSVNGRYFECPSYSTNFQKVIGYKPVTVSLSASSLIYKNTERYLPPKAINLNCWKICKEDKRCFSYVLYFNVSECYGFTKDSQNIIYEQLRDDSVLVPDNNAIYFEKFCMPGLCSNNLWSVLRMPGRKIHGIKYKTISHLVNRAQCIKYCLDEFEFKCKSVSFIVSFKNNRNRVNEAHLDSSNNLGQCILNEEDKNSHPEILEFSFPDHEYIEITCTNENYSNLDDYCFFEKSNNVFLTYADLEYENIGPFECESKCLSVENFTCLGYSMVNNACLIHSEKPIFMDNQAISAGIGAYYMERKQCLNVTCSNDEMTITYYPKEAFYGKISGFDQSYSSVCSSLGIGAGPIQLNLPIGNEIKESLCGVNRAYHIGTFGNRTLLQTKIMIQNHPPVASDNDKVLKVGCIVNNYNNRFDQKVLISQNDYPIDMRLPSISFKMLTSTLEEVNQVNLGDIIELQINMFPADVYDMHARNLFARSLDGRQNIQLLDFRGCPTDSAIFPSILKRRTKTSLILFSRFSVFKFIDSPIINFDITVNFCEQKCPTIICDFENKILSNGRRRRDVHLNESSVVEDEPEFDWESLKITKNSSKEEFQNKPSTNESAEILSELKKIKNFVDDPKYFQKVFTQYTFIDGSLQDDSFYLNNILQSNSEIKLHFQMFVGEPKEDTIIVDSYNINNSKIFVALTDADKNIVKLDSSLLAAILIFWFIVNAIIILICYWLIKRYKNQPEIYYSSSSLDRFHHISQFDSLDRRGRVHWSVPSKSSESLHI